MGKEYRQWCRRQEGDDTQGSVATVGTAADIDAEQTLHPLFECFRGPRHRRGLVEQGSATHEPLAAATVGEKAEVTDAHEAGRQDVEQEAADELAGQQSHHFDPVAVGVVFPAKAHAIVFELHQPIVAEGGLA